MIGQPLSNPLPDSGARLGKLWRITALVLGLTFFGIEHQLKMSVNLPGMEGVDSQLDEMTESGSTLRRVSYTSVGAFALLLLALPAKRRLQPLNAVVLLMLAYCGFCALSYFWSDDPALTFRRLPILAFCLLAVLGIAKHFNPREVCWLVLAVTGSFLLVGVAAEVALGALRPHLGDYRFSGTTHPNTQGINCALLALAGLVLARDATRGRWLLLGSVALAVLFLLLTKSRTSCFAFAAAVWVLYVMRLKGHSKPLAVFATGFAGGTAVLLLLFASNHLLGQVYEAALLGRTEQASSFSGRVPLWREILAYVEYRPWLGYGYGAFWNVERVQDFIITQGWQISHAHSGLFEPLANVGVIGVALFAAALVVGVLQALRRHAQTGDQAYAFILAQVAFGAVSSIGDAYYVIPSFCATVCACSLASMAMTRRQAEPSEHTVQQVASPPLTPVEAK